MNQVSIFDKPATEPLTMTSREIADFVGKDISHIHRDIRVMLDELKKDDPNLNHPQEDKDSRGYTTCFYLNRELTDTLLTGYSASARLKVIRRWHELESKAAAPKPIALPHDYISALEHLLEAKKCEAIAIEQRDYALATKAQIGSKREATAMATASAAKRESATLKAKLGMSHEFATIIAVESATKAAKGSIDWRPLKSWCKDNNAGPTKVPCARFGTAQAWPAAAWMSVYKVDLSVLFQFDLV